MTEIHINGEKLVLLPEKAILWPRENALILSDMHWGKTAHFRKNGIAIPRGSELADEKRLNNLVNKHSVSRLIIAGDMFHSSDNNDVSAFRSWKEKHSDIQVDLIIGNHDILDIEKYTDWGINIYPEFFDNDTFCIAHDELLKTPKFCIHGHIHPAIRISGNGRNSLKLDCFCVDEHRLILPAFGSFTGSKSVEPTNHKHIYVIAGTEVVKWT